MKPFTSKHCTQYLTKSSPLNQRQKVKSLAEKEYEQDLRREKRMPGFAEKPEGGIQKAANKNKSEAKRKMSQPTAPKPTTSKSKEGFKKIGSDASAETIKNLSSDKYRN